MLCSLIDNSIMKILYLLFSMNLYLSYVSSRTLHAAGIKHVGSEPKAELQIKLKPKIEDNIIWTKVETKSGLAIPSSHDGNNSSHEEKFISKTFASLKHQEKEDSEAVAIMTESWIKNRKPLGKESLFPGNNSAHDPTGFLGNHSQDNSNSSEFSDELVTGNLFSSLLSEWDSENISDVVTFDFDDGNESTIAKMLIESVQPIEQITSNGTFIIMEDDVNLFQEVSTFGFEFLIDSETTRNSFISDLLISQNNSIIDDLDDELATLLQDWEQSTLENENFGADNSSLDEETIILLSSKNETENLVSEKRNMRDFNFTGSEQNTITERITPVCPEPDLSEFIPKDYDKLSPPKKSEMEPVNVTVGLYVIQIRSVDEVEMDFKMDILIRQSWQDFRLIFPPESQKRKVVIDPKWREEIWTPDVWFKNALDTKLQQWEVPSVFYWIEQNMTVCFSGRVTLELSCDMDMQNFPHDTQLCGVDIMALMNPAKDLHLNWKENEPVRVSRIMRLPQFDVEDIHVGRCDSIMYGEMFSCIKASFTMIRRGGYFLINVYIPTVLIVLMSMLTFWIPPEAVPARITLGVTSLLTIITKQYQSSMPTVSYIVALNIWLSCCVAFVFCSLLEYAIVITLLRRDTNKIKPVDTDSNKPEEESSERNNLKTAWKVKSSLEKISGHTIDLISRISFPFFFSLFCIIYSVKYSYIPT